MSAAPAIPVPSPLLSISIPIESLTPERIRTLTLEDIETLNVSQLSIAQTGELMERINDLAAQFSAEQKAIQQQQQQEGQVQQHRSTDLNDARPLLPSSDAIITESPLPSETVGAIDTSVTSPTSAEFPATFGSPSPAKPSVINGTSDPETATPNTQPKRPSLLSQILAAPTIHEVDGEDDEDEIILPFPPTAPASQEPPPVLLTGDAKSCEPLIEAIYATNRRRTLAASVAPRPLSPLPLSPSTENARPLSSDVAIKLSGGQFSGPNPQSFIDSVLSSLPKPSDTLHPRLAYHVAQTKLHQITERIDVTDAYWRQYAKWKRRLAKLESEKYRKYGGGPDSHITNASSSSLAGGGGSDSGPSSGRPRGGGGGGSSQGGSGGAISSSSGAAQAAATPAHLLGHGTLPGVSSARRVRGATPLVDAFGRHGDHRSAGDLLYARSEEDVARMIQQIEDSREERIQRLAAPIPDMLVDLPTRRERAAKLAQHYPAREVAEALREEFGDVFYPDIHGANKIHDPVMYYSDLRVARGWLPCEEAKFLRAYLEHTKDFARIAAEVGTRNHAQCVQFYYLNKHRLQLKKEHKRFRRLRNAGGGGTSVLDIAITAYAQQQQQQAAAAAAAAVASNTLPGTPFHSPAVNPLVWNSPSGQVATIGGLPPAGLLLKPTSSRWSLQETEAIKSAVAQVGKDDLASIAIRVKSKTMDQCKNWLHNHKDTVSKLIRDEERKRTKHARRLMREGTAASMDFDDDADSLQQDERGQGGDDRTPTTTEGTPTIESPGGGSDTNPQVDTGSGAGSARGRAGAAKKKRKRESGALGLEEHGQPRGVGATRAPGRRKSTRDKLQADGVDATEGQPPMRRQRLGSNPLSPGFPPVSAAFPQQASAASAKAIHIPNIPSPQPQPDQPTSMPRGPLLQPIGPGPDLSTISTATSAGNGNVRGSTYWRTTEKDQFEALYAQFGANWEQIAAGMGTKSAAQVQRYFQRRQRQVRPAAPNAPPTITSPSSTARVSSKSPAPSGADAGGDNTDASGDEREGVAKRMRELPPTTPVLSGRRASSVVPSIAPVPQSTPDRLRQQPVKQSPKQSHTQGQAQSQQQGSRPNPLLHVRSPSPMHARRRTASQPLPRPQGSAFPGFDGATLNSNKYVASSLSNAATIGSAHLSGVLPFPAPFPGSIPSQFLGLHHVAHLAQQQHMQHQMQQQQLQQQQPHPHPQHQQAQHLLPGSTAATGSGTSSGVPASGQQGQVAMPAPGINPLAAIPPQYPGYQFPFPTFGYYYPPPTATAGPPGSFPFRTAPYPSLQRPLYSPFHTQNQQMGTAPAPSSMPSRAPQPAPVPTSSSGSATSFPASSSGPTTLTFTTSAAPATPGVPTAASSGPMSSVSVAPHSASQQQQPQTSTLAPQSQAQPQPMVHHHHHRHMHHHAHMAAAVQHLPTAAAVAQVHAEYPTVTYPTVAGPTRPDTPSAVSLPASTAPMLTSTLSTTGGVGVPLVTTQPTPLPPLVASAERPILPPILNSVPAVPQSQQQHVPAPLLPPSAGSIPLDSPPSQPHHVRAYSREHTVESAASSTDHRPTSGPPSHHFPPPPPQTMEPATWASIASRAGSEHPASRRGSISSRAGGPSPQGTPIPLPVPIGGSAPAAPSGPGSSSSYPSRFGSPSGLVASHTSFGGPGALSPPSMGPTIVSGIPGDRFPRLPPADELVRLPPIRVLESSTPPSGDSALMPTPGNPSMHHSSFSTAAPVPPPAASHHYPSATDQSLSSGGSSHTPAAPMSIQFTLPHPQAHSGHTASPFSSASHGLSVPPSGSPPPLSTHPPMSQPQPSQNGQAHPAQGPPPPSHPMM